MALVIEALVKFERMLLMVGHLRVTWPTKRKNEKVKLERKIREFRCRAVLLLNYGKEIQDCEVYSLHTVFVLLQTHHFIHYLIVSKFLSFEE